MTHNRVIHNVTDRFMSWIGPWEARDLDYDRLTPEDLRRRVIYVGHRLNEVGFLSSYRNGLVFVRFHFGSTGASVTPDRLVWAICRATLPLLEQPLEPLWDEAYK